MLQLLLDRPKNNGMSNKALLFLLNADGSARMDYRRFSLKKCC